MGSMKLSAKLHICQLTVIAYCSLYKGLYPLWGRQIPYTMMKFASFETVVEMIYNYLPGKKSDYGKLAQTGVSFAGGYIAGILCAIVSHPADVRSTPCRPFPDTNILVGHGIQT